MPPRLSDLQRASGQMLAALIESRQLDGTSADARFLLRGLAMQLLDYADETQALEEQLRPRTPRELTVVRLRPPLAVVEGGRV